jgi:hypothetical protein
MDSYAFQLYSQILKIFWRVFLIILAIALIVFDAEITEAKKERVHQKFDLMSIV